ncbi:class D sortase [Terribacillus saccharophilus]|uniref:Sortase n=1 Tax=Terribacillus saccharophilus TaxID=361277 RepID=A0ABX4GXZ9_9BACI|nr:class D sortase [Terribacillus saccharophilus]PAD35248.1 sortase [Terribacillus saccharophilus]PAD95997.1 sortase [Terribacillus saccharophilus]PAD99679.1 sortase [Terribacillus saccharophilus]
MKKGKLIAGVVFLLLGVALVATPLSIERMHAKEVNELEKAFASIEAGDVPQVGEEKNQKWSENELADMMKLEIPSIELEQYVLNETTDENLAAALTQIKTNQNPAKDNFSIAGHRGYRGDRFFRQLPEVKAGAEIKLQDKDATYIYEVDSVKIVEPNDIAILENTDKPEITLVTCTLSGKQRVAVTGKLIEVQKT